MESLWRAFPPEVLVLLVSGGVMLLFATWSRRWLRRHARRAIDEALKVRLSGLAPSAAATFESLTLLRESQEVLRGGRVQVTRLYGTPDGRYLLFLCTSGEPGYLQWLGEIQARRHLDGAGPQA